MTLEVCTQAVADNGDAVGIDQITEPVNDLRRKELYFVNDNAVIMLSAKVFEKVFSKFAGFLQTNTGLYHFCTVPVLASRLQQYDPFVAFIVVISHHQCIGCL